MSTPTPSTITESILITNDGYTIGNKNLDAVSSNTGGFVSMGSDGYSLHPISVDGYGKQNINIQGLTSSNFGYARCILVPGVISTDYVIATAATSANTPGTPSASATYAQGFVSPGGGNVSITMIDGQSVVIPAIAGFVYACYFKKVNSAGTFTTDLQIFL
jgi:hypothetical protein